MKLYFIIGTTTEQDEGEPAEMPFLFVRAATGARALELFREHVRTIGALVTATTDELPSADGEEQVTDPAVGGLPRTFWVTEDL